MTKLVHFSSGNTVGFREEGSTCCRAQLTTNWPTGFLADSLLCDILHLWACVLSAMLANLNCRHMTHRKPRNSCWVSSVLLPCNWGSAAGTKCLSWRFKGKFRSGIQAWIVIVLGRRNQKRNRNLHLHTSILLTLIQNYSWDFYFHQHIVPFL